MNLLQGPLRARLIMKAHERITFPDPRLPILTHVHPRDTAELGEKDALITAITCLPLEVLGSEQLWPIAQAVHSLTRTPATTSASDLQKSLHWIALQPDKGKIQTKFRYGAGSFMVTSGTSLRSMTVWCLMRSQSWSRCHSRS
ncbi:hypothetical protein FRB94_009945 [Tulasnella sp. JGI-2019a]|nr:hypothetical protein FRB93_007368 [Tulasnella sp. JGI-2019a]KAG8994327.1 hypothetical protein FRB94_009945 [Tulasnella sp. JGI-2019a]KAG9024770.1 hypothetical protein FRB95_011076 [Tulasnella sp. JGI-2019a]